MTAPLQTPVLPELAAFLDAATRVDPHTPTPCGRWTAHDVVAHVVAGGAELLRLLSAQLHDGVSLPTTPFDEREPPFRALPYDTLLELLTAGGLGALLDAAPDDAVVDFTGWTMDLASLRRHLRSELAVHAWDLAPDADVALLGAPDLTEHAARSMTQFDSIGERVAARDRRIAGEHPTVVRLRAQGQLDVVVTLDPQGSTLAVGEPADGPGVVLDPADRLLLLWGRRPVIDRVLPSEAPGAGELEVLRRWLVG